jgi:hypothetical protein
LEAELAARSPFEGWSETVGPSLATFPRGAGTSLFPKPDVFDPPSVVVLASFSDGEPALSDPKGRTASSEWLFSPMGVGAGGASTPPSAYASAKGGLGPLSLQYSTTPTKHRKEQDTTKPALVSRVMLFLLSIL